MVPKYSHSSVPESLADAMEKDIRRGLWNGVLPGYRGLAEKYGVSRNSAAKALHILEMRGLIHPAEKGRKRRIKALRGKRKKINLKLLIIIGKYYQFDADLENLSSMIMSKWMERGGTVETRRPEMARIKSPEKMIKRWVETEQPDALLVWVGARVWLNALEATGLPMFCMGGELSDVLGKVAGCGFDIGASVRKALFELRARGHQRILFPDFTGRDELRSNRLIAYNDILGDLFNAEEIESFCPHFQESIPEVWRSYWEKALIRVEPTAVICERATDLLSFYGFCYSVGIKIPKDLSVICLGSSSYLEWLWPRPTRLYYPERREILHYEKWLKSDLTMREFIHIPLVWEDGGSVMTL